MKKALSFLYIILITLLIIGCNNSGSSNNSSTLGTLIFSNSSINVTNGSSRELTLSFKTTESVPGLVVQVNSSDTSIATVSPANCTLSTEPGVPTSCAIIIKGIANGSASITASAPNYTSATTSVTVSSGIIPGTLSFNKSSESITLNSTNNAILSLSGSSGVESLVVTINSSNNGIVTTTPTTCTLSSGVNRSCNITLNGAGNGNATITATANGYEASAPLSVTVSNAINYGTISFNTTSLSVTGANSNQVTLSLNNSSGITNATVSLISQNTGIATVSKSTCTLSSTSGSNSCNLLITGVGNGNTQIIATSTYDGHIYTITPISVTVTNNTELNLSESVANITETIYSGQTYSPVFTFINNGSTSITLGAVRITDTDQLVWQLNSDQCSGKIINANGGTCTISGTVNINNPNTNGRLEFFLPNSTGTSSYSYDMSIYGIQFISGYAPVRIVTPTDGTGSIYFVALVGGVPDYVYAVPIQYTLQNGVYMGSINAESVTSIAPYTMEVPQGGMIVYTPVMLNHNVNAGGRFYISYESALTAVAGGMPDPLAQNVPSLYYEYNVPSVNSVYTDMTYVDFTSVPVAISSVNITNNLNTMMGVKPEFYDTSGTTIINNMKTAMSQYTGVFNMPAYFKESNNQLLAVLSPSSVFTQPNVIPAGFESAIFNTYTSDLWSYYAQSGNYIVLNATEISNQLGSTTCQLRGHVENDNLMHFTPYPNDAACPTGSYTIATGQTFNTGSNNFTMQETAFNYYGFFSAFADQSVYGANGTYQSLLKYIAGAQAAGFLPFCPQNGGSATFVYGHGVLAAYSSQYFKPNYDCLPNYTQYGEKVINQYDHQVHTYFNSYGYGYDDSIGIDGTVNSDATKYPSTVHILKFSN